MTLWMFWQHMKKEVVGWWRCLQGSAELLLPLLLLHICPSVWFTYHLPAAGAEPSHQWLMQIFGRCNKNPPVVAYQCAYSKTFPSVLLMQSNSCLRLWDDGSISSPSPWALSHISTSWRYTGSRREASFLSKLTTPTASWTKTHSGLYSLFVFISAFLVPILCLSLLIIISLCPFIYSLKQTYVTLYCL